MAAHSRDFTLRVRGLTDEEEKALEHEIDEAFQRTGDGTDSALVIAEWVQENPEDWELV